MVMNKKYFLSVGFFFAIIICQAQDFKALIYKMKNEISAGSKLQVVMRVSVFDTKDSAQPYYEEVVDIRKDGDNYWYNFDDKEMLLNGQAMIMVDRQSRQINYSKRDVKAEKQFYEAVKFDLDSILSTYGEFGFMGNVNGVEHYVVNESKGPISKIHFYISTDAILKKIEYEYSEGPFASINFLLFDGNPSFDSLTFSENRIVEKIEKKLYPSKYYRNYKLNFH